MKKQWSLVLVLLFSFVLVSGVVSFFGAVAPATIDVVSQSPVEDSSAHADSLFQGMGSGWLAAVQEDVRQSEYHVTWQDSTYLADVPAAYQAPNRAQNIRTYFTPEGIRVVPRDGATADWEWGLSLVSYGYADVVQAVETAPLTANGNRLIYHRGNIDEWYVNDERGLEQGFTIQSPLEPDTAAPLHLDLALSGNLIASVMAGGQAMDFVTTEGLRALQYSDLHAYDALGRALPAHMELVAASGDQYTIRLVVEAANAAYPIMVDPITSSSAWAAYINQDAHFGFAVNTAGDVNGDGFDDVIIGAHWYDDSGIDEGAAFAYYGSPVGLSPTYNWRAVSGSPGAEFGISVSTAGDVNDDGFDDVIIGANLDNGGQGAAYLYRGSPAGLMGAESWIANGDQPGSGFAWSVSTAGDVNGDGYADVIIGAPYYSGTLKADEGRAYVHYGSLSGLSPAPDWIAESDTGGSSFGFSVGTAGDFNKDSCDDIIIGASTYQVGNEIKPKGLAAVYYGCSPTGLPDPDSSGIAELSEAAWTVTDGTDGSFFGHSVGTAGDVNGDGYGDIIVGAPNYSESLSYVGAAFAYYGMADVPSSPDWFVTEYQPDSYFGHVVGTAGDVNADGYDDVIVGAPEYTSVPQRILELSAAGGEGKVFVYSGGGFGLDTYPFLTYSTVLTGSLFGHDAGTAGDVNGDGHADIIIGAPQYTVTNGYIGLAVAFYGSGPIMGLEAFNDSPTPLGLPTDFWATVTSGGSISYTWSFGDGATAVGQKLGHVYGDPGIYTAIVTATNIYSVTSASTTVTITVDSLIDPGAGGNLDFTDPLGRGINVGVPGGAVTSTVQLAYTPLVTITQPAPTGTLNYYFDLDVVETTGKLYLPIVVNGAASNIIAGVSSLAGQPDTTPSFVTAGGSGSGDSYNFLVPITIKVIYTDDQVVGQDENALQLLFWDEVALTWVDAAMSCTPPSDYTYNPAENWFSVEVCHLSRFGVIGAN